MAGTIICYGDSNTYGYDPLNFYEGRFSARERWPEILESRLDVTVRNHGLNGREIPQRESEIRFVCELMSKWTKKEEAPVRLWIMLGTNDVLRDPRMSAEATADRMERLLGTLIREPVVQNGQIRLRLIAPPALCPGQWVEDEAVIFQSIRLQYLYQRLAETLGIDFTNAGAWDIPLIYDGVHFSAEGHRNFAREMERVISEERL